MAALNHSAARAARGAGVICAFLGLFLGGICAADEAPRLMSPEEHAGLQAIGRVNQAGHRTRTLCTGTLIAPDLVLTAAHCFDATLSDPIVFVAGWYRGGFAASEEVAEVFAAEGFHPSSAPTLDMVARDWAVLRLRAPIETVTPLGFGAYVAGLPVTLPAYSVQRPHALSVREACPVQAVEEVPEAGKLMLLRCPSLPGNSGGPALMRFGAEWRVVGVVSAAAADLGGSLAAVPWPDGAEATR